jgi:tRNA-splicing ligase RtcB
MEIKKISDFKYEVEKTGNMRVPAIIYSSPTLLPFIEKDLALQQLLNVASLKGIISYSIGMPDMHQGYAFPIGGIAAFDAAEGVVSPGGVGFDINCGVRVIRTNLRYEDVKDYLPELGRILFKNVPSGVGSTGLEKFGADEARRAMKLGLMWAQEKGFAEQYDIENIEDSGCLESAEPEFVSRKAVDRGREEFGTLGAGNHFLEIDKVEKIYDPKVAQAFGLFEGQIVIWIHTGSRGLGHQIATDFIQIMLPRMETYKIPLFDKDFVSLPIRASESQMYLGAMAAAANFAWVNRQVITYFIRKSFSQVFKTPFEKLGMDILYDVAHNIAKFEKYTVGGKEMLLLVHRKGATRAFPKGHPALKGKFREIGQPVLLPGDMRRGSYILVGSNKAVEETFGSVAHGAGRLKSRHSAVKEISFEEIKREMDESDILLFAADKKVAREEAPQAYKDVDAVVEPIIEEGLATAVARTKPLLVIKG